MGVDATLLMREVQAIADKGDGLQHYRLTCRIRAGNHWMSPMRLTHFSLERDYESANGDGVSLELQMGRGEYTYRIVPNRDELWVDLTATPLYENSDIQRGDKGSNTRRYRAILVDQEDDAVTGRSPQAGSEEDLNRSSPKVVHLQLMDEGFYQSRMVSVGRNYRKIPPAQALRSLLTETRSLVTGKDQQKIRGADLVEGFNTKPREQIVIPHGTPLLKVPKLLQEEEGGIYPTGLGCYLQDGLWYIYPLYNLERHKKDPRVLTVLNVPPNRYHGAERTFRKTKNQVVVVATGNMAGYDTGLYGQLNEGNAMRFMDADQLLNPVEHGDNKAIARRQDNMFEFEGAKLKSGFSNARWAPERATSNPFKYYSKLAHRKGRYVLVQWQHGDSSLLYPGMPVKFLTNANNELKTLHGVLVGVHEQRMAQEPGPVNSRYPAIITLKLFLEREETRPQQ